MDNINFNLSDLVIVRHTIFRRSAVSLLHNLLVLMVILAVMLSSIIYIQQLNFTVGFLIISISIICFSLITLTIKIHSRQKAISFETFLVDVQSVRIVQRNVFSWLRIFTFFTPRIDVFYKNGSRRVFYLKLNDKLLGCLAFELVNRDIRVETY
jgi:hypothetical protein